MQSTIKKCLKGICFVAVFALLFLVFQEVLRGKWVVSGKDNTASTSTFKEYKELEEGTVDALFVGTSHLLYGIDPMYMYEHTGITGFVFGGPGLRLDLSYLTLKDALDKQTPEVVILDASGFHYTNQQAEARARKFADQLPLTWEKVEYAFNNGNEELDPLSVMFPLIRYHSRWDNLTRVDLQRMTGTLEDTYVRGHHISFEQVPANLPFDTPEEGFAITERNLDYFDRIVRLCEERGIPLLVCKVPTPDWNITCSQAVAEVAKEQGVPYLELYYELDEIGIDTATDFHDDTDHMNQYGAEKLTLYMAEYLKENYGLTDHRGEYEKWDRDIPEYHAHLETVKTEYEELLQNEATKED